MENLPQTSIFISYFPNFSKYFLFITKRPPAIMGVSIEVVGSLCRSARSSNDKYSHLNTYWAKKSIYKFRKLYWLNFHRDISICHTKFQSKPPRRSADAPIYWNVSMLMTSMTGHTTLNTIRIKKYNQLLLRS